MYSVEESAKYMTSYMDLFEKVLTYLVTNPPEDDENSKPPLLSAQPLSPMLGIHIIMPVHIGYIFCAHMYVL